MIIQGDVFISGQRRHFVLIPKCAFYQELINVLSKDVTFLIALADKMYLKSNARLRRISTITNIIQQASLAPRVRLAPHSHRIKQISCKNSIPKPSLTLSKAALLGHCIPKSAKFSHFANCTDDNPSAWETVPILGAIKACCSLAFKYNSNLYL